jgi:hypothetical protein
MKPPTISEEDEDAEVFPTGSDPGIAVTADKEVSDWVIGSMERRRAGAMGKSKSRPPRGALDAMPSPSIEQADGFRGSEAAPGDD